MDIKLILVVENRIYCEGIDHFFTRGQGFEVLAVYTSCEMAIVGLTSFNADILVVDYHMPSAMDMLKYVKQSLPMLKVVMVTHKNDPNLVPDCAIAGIEGVITENDSLQDLMLCIQSVQSGHICYPANSYSFVQQSLTPSDSVYVEGAANETNLTLRQVKVMRLVEQGYSNKEIARMLNIELCTVKNHMHNILDKLSVKNRCEAVSVFRRSVGQLV